MCPAYGGTRHARRPRPWPAASWASRSTANGCSGSCAPSVGMPQLVRAGDPEEPPAAGDARRTVRVAAAADQGLDRPARLGLAARPSSTAAHGRSVAGRWTAASTQAIASSSRQRNCDGPRRPARPADAGHRTMAASSPPPTSAATSRPVGSPTDGAATAIPSRRRSSSHGSASSRSAWPGDRSGSRWTRRERRSATTSTPTTAGPTPGWPT